MYSDTPGLMSYSFLGISHENAESVFLVDGRALGGL